MAFLERTDPPAFVAVTGKARTFQPDDSDRIYTSVRPESIATVDADTRDRWVVDSAARTVDRIAAYADAADRDASGDDLAETLLESGLDESLANGIPVARDHYGTTSAYLDALRTLALDAVRIVAGDRDEVGAFDLQPGDAGDGTVSFAELADRDGADTAPSADATAPVEESEEDELGDFESGGLGDEMYEMDDEERAEVEDEFGTEFTTGTEVDEPGEAGIELPESEPESDTEGDADSDVVESDRDDEPATDEDVDLQAYVVETMRDLDDGSGADRGEVIATVSEDTGASDADVEDAIQDALMGGQCYEPDDETLMPI
jgi:hypothetical protein